MALIHRTKPPAPSSDTASVRLRTDQPRPAAGSASPPTDEIADAAAGLPPPAGVERHEHDRVGPVPEPVPEDVYGLRLLISDTRVAFMLINEAHYRTVHRLFRVPRDQAWLVTLVGLGVLAHTANRKFDHLVRGPGGPTRADAVLGLGALREASYAIAGPSSRNVPGFAALVALSVTGNLMRPVVAGALHGLKASSHDVRVAFKQRYGHHVTGRGRPS